MAEDYVANTNGEGMDSPPRVRRDDGWGWATTTKWVPGKTCKTRAGRFVLYHTFVFMGFDLDAEFLPSPVKVKFDIPNMGWGEGYLHAIVLGDSTTEALAVLDIEVPKEWGSFRHPKGIPALTRVALKYVKKPGLIENIMERAGMFLRSKRFV